jgi:NADPH:quinone reductase
MPAVSDGQVAGRAEIMRAAIYRETGSADVLHVVERPEPSPGPGEVVVQVRVSGVNPTDWKARQGGAPGQLPPFPEVVPNQDGAGVVVATGQGVAAGRVGERVWLWEAAWQRPDGTAQEQFAIPEHQAVHLPDGASFDLGASIGIPALTAHRCLTVGGTDRLHPGALEGQVVLVAGGAGAVGHAAIELARWAGARVAATVSSAAKESLAAAAGADLVVNYREQDVEKVVRGWAPDGVDTVVEVALGANAALDVTLLRPGGTVASYASDRDAASIPIRPSMQTNARWQFVLVYTVARAAKGHAVADVGAALADGALRVGEEAGLPLHRFSLEHIADAHRAVEAGVTGKVLVDIG